MYPGTVERRMLYEQLRELVLEAKAVGLAVVVWAYPRGGELPKKASPGWMYAPTLRSWLRSWVRISSK